MISRFFWRLIYLYKLDSFWISIQPSSSIQMSRLVKLYSPNNNTIPIPTWFKTSIFQEVISPYFSIQKSRPRLGYGLGENLFGKFQEELRGVVLQSYWNGSRALTQLFVINMPSSRRARILSSSHFQIMIDTRTDQRSLTQGLKEFFIIKRLYFILRAPSFKKINPPLDHDFIYT